jgi:hypothetical protein
LSPLPLKNRLADCAKIAAWKAARRRIQCADDGAAWQAGTVGPACHPCAGPLGWRLCHARGCGPSGILRPTSALSRTRLLHDWQVGPPAVSPVTQRTHPTSRIACAMSGLMPGDGRYTAPAFLGLAKNGLKSLRAHATTHVQDVRRQVGVGLRLHSAAKTMHAGFRHERHAHALHQYCTSSIKFWVTCTRRSVLPAHGVRTKNRGGGGRGGGQG